MNDNQIKTAQFLDWCYEIEVTAARIYYYYADYFSDNETMSKIWKKTADEEENHSAQVLLAKRLLPTGVFQIHIDPWVAQSTSKQLQELHKSILKSSPTIVDALHSSIEMEERFAQFHAENALSFEDKKMQNFFMAITKYDYEHIETMENALKDILANTNLPIAA
jgi:rubrerythrin